MLTLARSFIDSQTRSVISFTAGGGRFCFACDFTAVQTLLVQPQTCYFFTLFMKLFLLFCARCRSLEPGGQPKLFSCLCGPHPRLPLTTPPPQPPPVPSQPAASNVTTSRDMNITMTLAAAAWKQQRLHSLQRSLHSLLF